MSPRARRTSAREISNWTTRAAAERSRRNHPAWAEATHSPAHHTQLPKLCPVFYWHEFGQTRAALTRTANPSIRSPAYRTVTRPQSSPAHRAVPQEQQGQTEPRAPAHTEANIPHTQAITPSSGDGGNDGSNGGGGGDGGDRFGAHGHAVRGSLYVSAITKEWMGNAAPILVDWKNGEWKLF